ncbi:MAG: sigma-70 family RNA polymerase sigma factor [Kiritimatiellae bacterium]|nr:sigma-70 family RNA polymerase sigma factor [Kiritimatiellia bacterium]
MENDIAHKILHDRDNGAALLLSEYKSGLYSVALALCRDSSEAEDLVFRAVERAISKIDTFQNHDSLYSWLCVILVNTYRDSTRKKVVSGTFAAGGAAEMESFTEPAGPESLVSEIDGGFVRQALKSMPESMREVLILHYFMDMSTVKIAKFLALPVGTVKSRLHYARLALGARLGARLKKTGMVLIAASLFLTAVATAIVSVMPDADDGQYGDGPTPDSVSASGPSAAEPDAAAYQADGLAESGISGPQEPGKERKAMNNTILGGLFRKAARGISTLAMTMLAANATYGDDPYVESDGTSGISTGYRMNGKSRLEVDFALTTTSGCAQWRIFGDDAVETSLKTYFYIDGSLHLTSIVEPNGMSKYTTYQADTLRHTVVFDLNDPGLYFSTGGVTNWSSTSSVSFSGRKADMPLSLFGRWGNAQATKFGTLAKARIYGVKIYESDVLVRDFVPCLKDGVACFKDLVNGGFIIGENAAAFTAGGDVQTFADDAYVSTAANADGGKLYLDTGLAMTQDTTVELDCAFAEAFTTTSFWGLFESCKSSFRYGFTQTHNYGLRWSSNGTWHDDFTAAFPKTMSGKDVRRKYLLDFNGSSVAVVTSGFTNQTASFETQSFTAAGTIKLSSGGWGNGEYAPLKIYGCKIWENGALKRDFEPYVNNGTPGLRDSITGAFISASRGSGDTTSALAYGGAIVDDAYLEATGSVGINTGVKLNGRSRLEVDFSLTVTNANTKNWRVFGTDTQETNLKTWLGYDSAFNTRMEMAGNNRYPIKADTARHLAGMDMTSGKFLFVTGATTNALANATTDLSGLEASMPLPLFGRYSNAEGTAYHNYTVPKARIYSVRIYESDALVHEFLPYSRGGVVGFYDTVTGEIISNGSSFTFGGKGQDYGQLKAYVNPNYNSTISHYETTTLTAYAPGAASYRWLRDGEPIEGGTDGALSVAWMRGGTVLAAGSRVRYYQAVAVFEDLNGATRESEPSAPVDVKFRQRGMSILIK